MSVDTNLARKVGILSSITAPGGMWDQWKHNVFAASMGGTWADNTIYVEQNSPTVEEFEEVLRTLRERPGAELVQPTTACRDVAFGARKVTTSQGAVTRPWLDANVEHDFLRRHLTGHPDQTLGSMSVLDIGAGYGRLAAILGVRVAQYTCTDAVPISSLLCRYYLHHYIGLSPSRFRVMGLADVVLNGDKELFDLAINIHSWNECTLQQITGWLELLRFCRVPYLFTVSHGQLDSVPPDKQRQKAYYSWGNRNPSFRPLLEADYELIVEESIGLGLHPHALWKRKRN